LLGRAAAIVEGYDTGVTLRQLFYRLVAALLLPNTNNAYKSLSRHTAAARRAGTFPTLMDRGRTIYRYQTFHDPAEARRWLQAIYRRDRTQGQPFSVYLSIEKAGILEQVRALAGTPAPAHIEVPAPPPEDPLRASLLGLGVPEFLLSSHGPLTLPGVLAQLPAAPPLPSAPGSILVVVGEQSDVDAVALLLAERLRLEAGAICAAGARPSGRARSGRVGVTKASTADELAAWRARAAVGPQIGIVALAVGPEPTDRAEAAVLLRGCGAAQVWAVVDARTKTADATRWMADVGGSAGIDAVAVRGLFDTTQPGTVLDLGAPVVWVDGIPATTVAWAAALGQALGPTGR